MHLLVISQSIFNKRKLKQKHKKALLRFEHISASK